LAYQTPSTLAGWLAIAPTAGLSTQNFVPTSLYAQALTVGQRHIPAGASATWPILCQAFLISRGMIYWESQPGDCGSSDFDVSSLGFQATQAGGQVASGIAAMAGASLPGIGAAVQAITQIFQNHANAVITEEKTLCQMMGVINTVIPYYDRQVALGNISPSDALAGMQNYLAQVQAKLSTIAKKCNAACVYIGTLQAHADFCGIYYPLLAPAQNSPHAPGAPPSTVGTVPGGVIQVGTVGGSAVGSALTQPVNPSGYNSTPTVSATTFSSTELLIILAVVAGLIFLASEAL